MEFDVFATLISPESYVLIPVLYIILLLLRQTPRVPLWTHAWIAIFISVVVCFLYYGFTIQSFFEGVLVAGVAILAKDLIHRQWNKNKRRR